MEWHQLSPAAALEKTSSRKGGISEAEARSRLAAHGPNALSAAKAEALYRIFLRQFASPIIYILLAAAAVVIALSDFADAAIILVVLLVNAVVGAIQEGRAQNTLSALRKMVQTSAIVLRGEKEIIVPAEELVPGDVIVVKEGDKIPADARVVESRGLKIDESALTGESDPVLKIEEAIPRADLPAPDRKNMVFRGTYVVGGEARAVVVATGVETVIGGISEQLVGIDTDVPLKANIKKLSRLIIIVVAIACVSIFAIGLIRGIPAGEMFITAVAMAVSATPEGLPVVVTIVLAAGMYRMSRQQALVRKLQAVEALGQANIIAVDKTGTITLNQMAAERLWVDGSDYAVETDGYAPEGAISRNGSAIEPLEHQGLLRAGKIAALTASAAVAYAEEAKEWRRVSGDPTEAALLVLSRKIGFDKDALEQEHRRVADIPFSSATKYHASVNEADGSLAFSVAGAPEPIVKACATMLEGGKAIPLDAKALEAIERKLSEFSKAGLRMVALAFRQGVESPLDGALPELCFVGIVGISDSVRAEAKDAIDKARKAGVRVVMITGDHPETAKAIAAKVDIYRPGDAVVVGTELSKLTQAELAHILPKATVFARVVPEDKLKIIEAYRKNGDIVAMTGDGVNDALSLAAADLGVAMGKIGTEVAKEASDMVLLDDNFGSIVAAIEEGRNVYRSIRKVLLYLFSTSAGEVLTIASAILLGLPVPLLPGQIIWMNFVTDGFLVVALALEPKERNLLSPGKRKSRLVDGLVVGRIALISATMLFCALYLFYAYLPEGFAKASTVALTTLTVCQWLNTLNCRTERHSIFRKGGFGNSFLLAALLIVFCFQLAALYAPPLQKMLHTVPLALGDWLTIAGTSLLVVIVEEVRKAWARLSSRASLS